ncbi:precorrin-6y C5,15-methyltransferase (decarboxylating) subunit CbiE [Roseococcus pinisoli]|uniref:Precorrin-6y C5,15-methyltransferase (Decarboxylating) subunit CbiE n=1 Tax=Roseococcus pinisoli TaxID=2835040 RepID=A0ABS5QJ39_9PROT|nr:precorrin-6y C5,15-methyltransferase (decarboxylating) subunit CbiE [Roseococcus pinisoli]MBS7813705.1 precorrin-6y C5,15-methyltransferase (decarboxylating) subunit CbiE [Roseococcus pinisoli]
MLAETAAVTRWLSILGIGEEGVAGLPPLSRGLIEGAEIVFGGRRHLELAAGLIRGEARAWPSPFDVSGVLAARGRRVVVLASGDPMLHGVGATLLRRLPPEEALVVPAPSAFSLAAARLGWPLEGVVTLSLHGRPVELLRPHLHPGVRLLALTSDADGPAAVAALLRDGFSRTRLTVLEALGGPRERIRSTVAGDFALADVAPLNLVALEVEAEPGARVLARAPGLPDDWFEHDGQLTKREIRAVTLSALAPKRGALLWDIGAGAGSIGIEWMLADVSLRAIAIETRPDRAARLRRNAVALGVPGLSVVEGEAPAALAGLEPPDAIFLGGGAGEALEAALAALKPGGRFVANAVTLETEALLLARHAGLGGEMIRLAVSRAAPVGGLTGWRAAMPVTQWIWDKPL